MIKIISNEFQSVTVFSSEVVRAPIPRPRVIAGDSKRRRAGDPRPPRCASLSRARSRVRFRISLPPSHSHRAELELSDTAGVHAGHPRGRASIRRAQSRTTSPSTSSASSLARSSQYRAESAPAPPAAIAASRRSSASPSIFLSRPSSVQIDRAVSFLAPPLPARAPPECGHAAAGRPAHRYCHRGPCSRGPAPRHHAHRVRPPALAVAPPRFAAA